MDQLIRTREAADILGVGKSQVAQYVKQGKLKTSGMSSGNHSSFLFSLEEVKKFKKEKDHQKRRKCDICGIYVGDHRRFVEGKLVCNRHYQQFKQHGTFYSVERSLTDLNDYRIDGDMVIFDVYDQQSHKVDEFIIDLDDLDLVKERKWRKSGSGYIESGGSGKESIQLHNLVMGFNKDQARTKVVDHINRIRTDCRKSNLRICTWRENTTNRSIYEFNKTGFIGVAPAYRSNDKKYYRANIKKDQVFCYLLTSKNIEEAVYARLIAERLLFKEFCVDSELKEEFTKNLSNENKKRIEDVVFKKLKEKGFVSNE